ncbi:hypothetical protein CDIK_3467 [Cucumispora dikerogammari]|nr:hypothetical protein CDIK_3467 [Cucumispora dikerogammari]
MLPEKNQACSNISTSKSKNFSITKQNELVNKFNIMREAVMKFHDERMKKLEEFDIKFKTLVEVYFPARRLLWKIKPDNEFMLKPTYLSSNAESLQHTIIKQRMRKLFFGDFLSFCNEFFETFFYQIQKEEIWGGRFSEEYWQYLFRKLDPSPNFAKQNAINIDFIYDIWGDDISFIFLLYRLEEMVGKHTHNSTNIIREILYLNPNFKFDIKKDQSIREFYYMISIYFSRYGRKDMSREPETFIVEFRRVDKMYYVYNKVAFLTEIVKNYKEYLKIDIEKDFEASKQQEADPRFISYTKNREVLKKCCIKENRNLIDVSCEEHQSIIYEIRLDYFRNIEVDLRNQESYFNDFVVSSIEYFYRKKYKLRKKKYLNNLKK